MTIAQAMLAAQAADEAFSKAISNAGYRSRWDWSQITDRRPYAAYVSKVQADEALHEAFEGLRSNGGEI